MHTSKFEGPFVISYPYNKKKTYNIYVCLSNFGISLIKQKINKFAEQKQ